MRLLYVFFLFSLAVGGQNPKTEKIVLKYSQERRLVKKDNIKEIQELIVQGLDTNQISDLLYYSCEYRKYAITKMLIDNGANVSKQYRDKNTPLLISTSGSSCNDSISELLIKKGANVNSVGYAGSTALRHTVGLVRGQEQQPRIFTLLVEYGADINYNCGECCNSTPFMYCCGYGTVEMVSTLLAHNVSTDNFNCKGYNGLMYAVENRNIEVAKLLISKKINLDKKAVCLEYARKHKYEDIISLLEDSIEK